MANPNPYAPKAAATGTNDHRRGNNRYCARYMGTNATGASHHRSPNIGHISTSISTERPVRAAPIRTWLRVVVPAVPETGAAKSAMSPFSAVS